MKSAIPLRFGAAPAALALLALAGCSIGATATPDAHGASPSPTRTDAVGSSDSPSDPAAASPAAPGGSSDSGSSADAEFPCNLYRLSDISALAGYRVATATPVTAVGAPDQHSCLWDTADHVHEFSITVAVGDGAQQRLQNWNLLQNGTAAAISGVGDAAYGNASGLAAVFGDVYVDAADISDANDESTPLANIGLTKLKPVVIGVAAAAK